MTRKKRSSPQHKRQQVTDSSGWIHVTKGPKSDINSIRPLPSSELQTGLTLDEYTNTIKTRYTLQWQESTCLQRLNHILAQNILTNECITLSKCVCLGLGSLTADTSTSSYELAALISMLEILGTKHKIQEVVFQDPAFNALDKAFLRSIGYTVLEDPEAFSRIDTNTFIFAPHLEVAQTAVALENSTPAIFVGNDLNAYVDGLYRRHAEEKKPGSCVIFQAYMDRTHCKAMPDFDRSTWTHGTNIYWLKDSMDDASAGETG